MAKDFLGKGWKFPVKPDAETGRISMSEYEEDIRESIWLILSTSKGERVMQPDFGCGINDFVFATINTTTLGLIKSSVQDSLTLWEPRIEVDNVSAALDSKELGKVWIDITYRIRTTNNEFNLVYPFYVQEG